MSIFTYAEAQRRSKTSNPHVKKYVLNRERMDGICARLRELVDVGTTGMANFTLEEMTEAEALELKSAGWAIHRRMSPNMFLSNPPKMYQTGWSVVLPSSRAAIDLDDDDTWDNM